MLVKKEKRKEKNLRAFLIVVSLLPSCRRYFRGINEMTKVTNNVSQKKRKEKRNT